MAIDSYICLDGIDESSLREYYEAYSSIAIFCMQDEGQVKCEEEHAFNEWHDIGYFMDLARETPEVFFE